MLTTSHKALYRVNQRTQDGGAISIVNFISYFFLCKSDILALCIVVLFHRNSGKNTNKLVNLECDKPILKVNDIITSQRTISVIFAHLLFFKQH